MSNFCFLFSICLITAMVSYTTWVNVNLYLNRISKENSAQLGILEQYSAYLTKFDKKYEKEELLVRFEYFKKSLKEISRLNALHPGSVYGLNKFSDMSKREFRRNMLAPVVRECKFLERKRCPYLANRRFRESNATAFIKSKNIPPRFDWRERGVVSRVVSQKYCHGCWAISIVGTMETMAAIATGKLYPLSAQELIDCAPNNRCRGGNVREALDFLCGAHESFPIVHEHDYPLMLVDEPCRIPKHSRPSGVKIRNFVNKCNMGKDSMLSMIANHGPLVVVVNAHIWYYYTNGVIQRACPSEWKYMDHVVQIVGYDLTAEVPYYIVKNSWGDDFGEDGYLKLAIEGNVCGVRNNVAYFDVV